MPSALEKLVKILRLEQEQGYKNTAVIGGLKRFADTWVQEGHDQAKKPAHHALVDELVMLIGEYETLPTRTERHHAVQFMLDRITNRVPPREAMAQPEAEEEKAPPVGVLISRAPEDPVDIDTALEEMRALEQPVEVIPRVGKSMSEKLARLGVQSVGDLLFFFPRRHDDYTKMKPLNRLDPGETVTLIGTVQRIDLRPISGGRKLVDVKLSDGTATLTLTWFNQPWLKKKFRRGSQLAVRGKVGLYLGRPTMTNPEWELLERDQLCAGNIVPVYPLTRGISARTMRRLTRRVLDEWAARIPDYLPASTRERALLRDLGWALQNLHYPASWDALEKARERLVFDELLLLQMSILAHRRDWQRVEGIPLAVSDTWLDAFLGSLPYALTGAQQRALAELRTDMAGGVPMNRLLQGDVGSGKTVVAAIAMAVAVEGGAQTALMAPTGILAEQHFKNLSALLTNSPVGERINIHLLTGATPNTTRDMIYSGLADGSINVVVGTHALIQSGLEFHKLGLAVIDEQHRFGVEQRGALRGKGTNPHLLVMSATPIPRTLALTLYADLDLALIDEMPPGRTPVDTKVLMPQERERAFAFIRNEVGKGRQAFVIYPFVESDSEMSAVQRAEVLRHKVFPDLRVGLLHGQLRPDEKDAVMADFAAGVLDVLVATSVVEVGIDVPNASVMLVEGAERFGLAQLHQFRGRVGRGEHASYCLLVASDQLTPDAVERLEAMEQTTDGFKLAEIDWEMRGPGDLLGTRQVGTGMLHMTELMNPRMVKLVQREARTLYAEDPDLAQPAHALLAYRIRQVQAQADEETDIS